MGEAKVTDLDGELGFALLPGVADEEDVVGGKIPVYDPARMQVGHAAGDLAEDGLDEFEIKLGHDAVWDRGVHEEGAFVARELERTLVTANGWPERMA